MTAMTARIRILSSAVANQIAAGEVIERPAAALKELLENSLDAGADRIVVQIEEGGINLLQVQDNGDGLSADELPLALARHATSKIRRAEDLSAIATYGFRGEALASLAAVAELTIASRPPDASHGWVYRSDMPAAKPQPMQAGTCISARALFADLPARRRFLRTNATEAGHCVAAVTQMAVASPNAALSLQVNQRQRFSLPAVTGLNERLTALFPSLQDNTLPVTATAGGLSLHGCVFAPSLPNSGKRIGQFLYVNGRYVRDRLLRRAVADALREVTHDGEPGYALFLQTTFGDIDVNVHPAKLEVRFSEPRAVFDFVRRAVGRALSAPLGAPIRDLAHGQPRTSHDGKPPAPTAPAQSTLPMSGGDAGGAWRQMFADFSELSVTEPSTAQEKYATHLPFAEGASPAAAETLHPLGRALGQIHDIYIVAENSQGLVVVDMHAAHERILYEELKAAADAKAIVMQPFLTPPQVPLTDLQAAILRAHETDIAGMEVRLLDDNTAEIKGVSALIAAVVEPVALLTDVLEDLSAFGEGGQAAAVRDRLFSSIACHAAVRANHRLTVEEMNALLRRMEELERSGTCNHGRPCWQQIERHYFDRVFRRGR